MNGLNSSRADDWPEPNQPLELERLLADPPEPDEARWSAVREGIAEAVFPPQPIAPHTTLSKRTYPSWFTPLLASAAIVLVGASASFIDYHPTAPSGGARTVASALPPVHDPLAGFAKLPIAAPEEVIVWSVKENPGKGFVVGLTPLPDTLVFAEPGEVEVIAGAEKLSMGEADERPMIFGLQR